MNTGPSCYRTMDLDMALGSSMGPDITKALGGSRGHPDQFGSQYQYDMVSDSSPYH